MSTGVCLIAALPQLPHQRDGFLEHLEPLVGRGPLRPEHVLVQVLTCADAQEEAAGHQARDRRRGVRDDRRVDANQRARDARADTEALRVLRDRSEDGPDEAAVSLRVDPRVDVVRDQPEAEARVLRSPRAPHQVGGRQLLRRQGDADFHCH
jgi:hypothetical protein